MHSGGVKLLLGVLSCLPRKARGPLAFREVQVAPFERAQLGSPQAGSHEHVNHCVVFAARDRDVSPEEVQEALDLARALQLLGRRIKINLARA